MDKLIAAIQTEAPVGEDLLECVDRVARLMKGRILASDLSLTTIIPQSCIDGFGDETMH